MGGNPSMSRGRSILSAPPPPLPDLRGSAGTERAAKILNFGSRVENNMRIAACVLLFFAAAPPPVNSSVSSWLASPGTRVLEARSLRFCAHAGLALKGGCDKEGVEPVEGPAILQPRCDVDGDAMVEEPTALTSVRIELLTEMGDAGELHCAFPPLYAHQVNPCGKRSQERLTRGTVTSTMRKTAHPPGCARCGAGAGCSAIKYQSLCAPGLRAKGDAARRLRRGEHQLLGRIPPPSDHRLGARPLDCRPRRIC